MPHINVDESTRHQPTLQPPAAKPMTKLSDAELDQLVRWLQGNTVIGRLAYGEVLAAFKRAADEAGFIWVRSDV